jgi:hypothetical protein
VIVHALDSDVVDGVVPAEVDVVLVPIVLVSAGVELVLVSVGVVLVLVSLGVVVVLVSAGVELVLVSVGVVLGSVDVAPVLGSVDVVLVSAELAAVSLEDPELWVESCTENHPSPPLAAGTVVSSVTSDADVAASGVAASGVAASGVTFSSVGVAGATEVAGSSTGVPIPSETTTAFANGPFGAALAFGAAGATCVCTSATIGTGCVADWRCAADWCCAAARGAVAGVATACCNGGRGASRCTFGTRRTGKATAGMASVGSGLGAVREGSAGCRHAAASGAAYMSTRTVSPRPAHQYRTPLNLSAVSPNGSAAATEAYEPVAFSPRIARSPAASRDIATLRPMLQ